MYIDQRACPLSRRPDPVHLWRIMAHPGRIRGARYRPVRAALARSRLDRVPTQAHPAQRWNALSRASNLRRRWPRSGYPSLGRVIAFREALQRCGRSRSALHPLSLGWADRPARTLSQTFPNSYGSLPRPMAYRAHIPPNRTPPRRRQLPAPMARYCPRLSGLHYFDDDLPPSHTEPSRRSRSLIPYPLDNVEGRFSSLARALAH